MYHFSFPTDIRFGAGAVGELAGGVAQLGSKRPFIVTDPGVAVLPFFNSILETLSKAGFEVGTFTGVHANPIQSDVKQAATKAKEYGADLIIALGGGSPMDAAKGVAIAAVTNESIFAYDAALGKPAPKNILPIIAIPTTAGTGSEVGRSGVISEDQTGIKHIIFSPLLLPRIVLADPELTLNLPPKITAATGMDALTHNVEAYLANNYHPICAGIALEGIRLVAQNLEKAVHEGANIEARSNMLMAAMMGAIAFQKGLGVTHSLAHPLSTVAQVPHGLANAICLPAALKFNAQKVGDQIANMARYIRLKDESGDGFISFVTKLNESIGIPKSLSEVGVDDSMLPRLVELAIKDGCHLENPRQVSQEDFQKLYQEVL